MRIWTIGHSTRGIDEFISLLKENQIKLLVDVRAFPGSKRYPQFNKDALADSLKAHGIRYEYFPELGATHRSADTPITWRRSNSSRESSACSALLPEPVHPPSCARKQSGGVAIAR
jgi:hypothetical protein